jgi:hypothetical protein
MVALAAISFGSVCAYGTKPKVKTMQTDTTKKKKKKTKKDTVRKKDTMKVQKSIK